MKTNPMILALVSSLSLFGAAGVAQAQEALKPQRGSVLVDGKTAKAVVVGPVTIHAYSAFSGATLFVVNASSGTDRDCAGARVGAAGVAADRVQSLTVGAGQIVCVATLAAHGSELLWHAQRDAAAPLLLARAR